MYGLSFVVSVSVIVNLLSTKISFAYHHPKKKPHCSWWMRWYQMICFFSFKELALHRLCKELVERLNILVCI